LLLYILQKYKSSKQNFNVFKDNPLTSYNFWNPCSDLVSLTPHKFELSSYWYYR